MNEDWIARAILRLAEQEKYVVEGGGAVGVAAIMAGLVPELVGKKLVLFNLKLMRNSHKQFMSSSMVHKSHLYLTAQAINLFTF